MNRVHNLGASNSLVGEYIRQLRDTEIQGDRLRFRSNIERLGEIFAYEISKQLPFAQVETNTPLGKSSEIKLASQPVLATILRAGLALHNGLLRSFDLADNAFISAYRKHNEAGEFIIELNYMSCPDLDDRIVIVSDPMLATGSSMVIAIEQLLKVGKPKEIHAVAVISSEEGIRYTAERLPNVHIWTAAIDPVLNDKKYIVPGLGDAGDLSFGEKVQN